MFKGLFNAYTVVLMFSLLLTQTQRNPKILSFFYISELTEMALLSPGTWRREILASEQLSFVHRKDETLDKKVYISSRRLWTANITIFL